MPVCINSRRDRPKAPFFGALLAILVSTVICQGRTLSVVVGDLEPNGVSKQVAKTITEHLRVKLIETGRFDIPERDQMEAILEEQSLGVRLSDCFSQECAIEIGRLLQANKMVVGTLSRLGRTYALSVRFLDLERGIAEFSTEETAEREDNLFHAAEMVAARIAASVPHEGTVVAVQDGTILIDTGSRDGLTVGTELQLRRMVEEVPGYPRLK